MTRTRLYRIAFEFTWWIGLITIALLASAAALALTGWVGLALAVAVLLWFATCSAHGLARRKEQL